MFFTPEGLEQSTGDAISHYRAARFPTEIPLLDACCGIGGDALAFSARGPVVAVDRYPAAVVCTRANADRFAHAFLRELMWVVLAIPAGLGFLTALFSPDRRGLHDRFAGTRVVR